MFQLSSIARRSLVLSSASHETEQLKHMPSKLGTSAGLGCARLTAKSVPTQALAFMSSHHSPKKDAHWCPIVHHAHTTE